MASTNINGFGSNDGVLQQIDPTFAAGRVSMRPLEYQPDQGIAGVQGGHYSIASETGSIAAGTAAGVDLFHMFWKSSTKYLILKKLSVQCNTLTAFTTLGGAPLELILAHGGTANGTGGTAFTMNQSNRMRQNMATTDFATNGEIRIATTGALTLPTGATQETNALASVSGPPWTTGVSPVEYLWEQRDAGDHPLILQTGDVLVIRTGIAVGASGVWVASITANWAESAVY